MKKYYKNFRTKKMSVESMSCRVMCTVNCQCQCAACGGNSAAAQGVISVPSSSAADNGTFKPDLFATGSVYG